MEKIHIIHIFFHQRDFKSYINEYFYILPFNVIYDNHFSYRNKKILTENEFMLINTSLSKCSASIICMCLTENLI